MEYAQPRTAGKLLKKTRASYLLFLAVLVLLLFSVLSYLDVSAEKKPKPEHRDSSHQQTEKPVRIDIDPGKIHKAGEPAGKKYNPPEHIQNGTILAATALLIVCLWYVFIPVIKIEAEGIRFSRWLSVSVFVPFTSISQLSYFKIKHAWYAAGEAVEITGTDGTVRNINLLFYRGNAAFLQRLYEHTQFYFPGIKQIPDIARLQFPGAKQLHERMQFSGNALLSLNTLCYGIPFVIVFFIDGKMQFGLAIIFFTLFYIIAGWRMFYFIISEGNLVIRNQYFFWYKKVIPLTDLVYFDLVSYSKQSDGLVIRRKNFRQHYFQAGSLRRKTWAKLREELLALGVKARRDFE